MDKIKALKKIASEIEKCSICKIGKVGKAVPGEGNTSAKIMFVGEAPGKTEAETGRPFVGRSGKFLRKLIADSGLSEEDVYITSPVKYLPKRGTPSLQEILHGKTHLDKQIEIINPEILVLLGSVACQAVLGEKIPVLRKHGEVIGVEGRKYLITLHPAAAVRFNKFSSLILKDFQKLSSLIATRKL